MTEIIEKAFNLSKIPTKDELVKFDGYDLLDKEHAIGIFLGKNWEEIYERISLSMPEPESETQSDYDKFFSQRLGTISDIENLQVLEPYGLQYYLKSYLLYLFSEDCQPRNTDDFTSYLIYTLKEILRIRGSAVFTSEQRLVLKQIATTLLHELANSPDDEEEYVYVKPLREYLSFIESVT